jgi:uncharacterized lipoprotein
MRKLILATCLLTLLAGCDGSTSTTQASGQSGTQQQSATVPMAGGGGGY